MSLISSQKGGFRTPCTSVFSIASAALMLVSHSLFAPTAMAQAIQERQMPLNEVNALVEGSQIQNPQFGAYQGSNVAPAPIANATTLQGQFDQNTYNQNVGSYNQQLAGLYSLGSSAAGRK